MDPRNQIVESYEFGPFRVDVAERVLTKGQQVIPLTPKAFDTLVVLVRKSGHVVEKDDLQVRSFFPASGKVFGGWATRESTL